MVISRRRKQKLRLLNSLKEKAILNKNPGRLLCEKYLKPNSKVRRHSGRKYPYCPYSQKLLDKEGIFIDYYWDDWLDWRDGLRDVSRIRKYCCFCWDHHIQLCASCISKIKKQIKIRKARQTNEKIYKL